MDVTLKQRRSNTRESAVNERGFNRIDLDLDLVFAFANYTCPLMTSRSRGNSSKDISTRRHFGKVEQIE